MARDRRTTADERDSTDMVMPGMQSVRRRRRNGLFVARLSVERINTRSTPAADDLKRLSTHQRLYFVSHVTLMVRVENYSYRHVLYVSAQEETLSPSLSLSLSLSLFLSLLVSLDIEYSFRRSAQKVQFRLLERLKGAAIKTTPLHEVHHCCGGSEHFPAKFAGTVSAILYRL